MSDKKTYDLVKYTYGRVRRYTAFCLTPHAPRKAIMGGVAVEFENSGKGSPEAQHFQRPETCKEWAEKNGVKVRAFSEEPLPGTSIHP